MRKFSSVLTIVLATAALGACSHYSDELSSMDRQMGAQQTAGLTAAPEAIQPAAGGANSFTQYLARDYYALARSENDKAFDYKSASAYTNKAAIASGGKIVIPSKLSSYNVPNAYAADLAAARANLITALKTQNTPDNAAALAKAQTRFDCWLEQSEEAVTDKHFAQCRSDFEQAMASLVTPAAGTATGSTYQIAFAGQSAVLDPAGQKDIDYIASVLKDPKNASYSVTLTGYVPAEAPGDLSDARIAAIQKALTDKGVSASQIAPVLQPAEDGAFENSVVLTLIAPTSGANTTTNTKFVPITPVPVPAGQ